MSLILFHSIGKLALSICSLSFEKQALAKSPWKKRGDLLICHFSWTKDIMTEKTSIRHIFLSLKTSNLVRQWNAFGQAGLLEVWRWRSRCALPKCLYKCLSGASLPRLHRRQLICLILMFQSTFLIMQTGSEAQLDFDSQNELMGLFDLNCVLHLFHLSSQCIVFQTPIGADALKINKNCYLNSYTNFSFWTFSFLSQ